MNLKHHFKFNIADAKQLGIALISSYGMWAATGFQKSISGLMYPIMGFVTGGLASHHNTADPGVLPDSHISTPYVNNINDGISGEPEKIPEAPIPNSIQKEPIVQTYPHVKIIPQKSAE
jgi:hypothetical protein